MKIGSNPDRDATKLAILKPDCASESPKILKAERLLRSSPEPELKIFRERAWKSGFYFVLFL